MSNESQVIIGETGANYQINSLSELQFICQSYFKELGITQNDISIINNLDQNFVYLYNLDYKPNSKYFLYSKRYNNKLLQSFYSYQNKNTADLSSSPSDILINLPDINKYFNILESNNEHLSVSLNEIKLTYDLMLKYHNEYISIYKHFNINVNLAKKINEYYKYQNEGVDLMNNIALLKYEKCFNKYQDFIKASETLKTNNDLILQNYMDNIDKLKKIELPENFIKYASNKKKNNNIKYLIDIYHTEKDMNIWRDNCLKQQSGFLNKVKSKDKILQKEKIQINKDNNTYLLPLKSEWNYYISEYDKLYQENNNHILSLLNEINIDFNLFNNLLSQMKEIFESKLLNSNPNYSDTIKDSCSKILSLKEKYSDMNKLSLIKNSLQQFNDYIIKMNNSIETISKKINDYFMAIRAIKNILEKLIEKFTVYLQALKSIEDDFKFLETPGNFINSYEHTLLELKRRNSFNIDMQEELMIIKSLINNENYLRKKFLEENKKYLTPDFIKLFKLENKIYFNYDFQNNNEHLDLAILFPEDSNNNSNNKTNFTNNFDINNITNNETAISLTQEPKLENNINKKILNNIMNQITELDTKLKYKEKELSDLQTKYKNSQNNLKELNKDMKNVYIFFDEISDSFNQELSFKESKISDLTQKLENYEKNSKDQKENNCPLCKDKFSNINYKNMEEVYQKMKDEINKYKVKANELDNNFKKLVNETTIIKTAFFNHMNMVIVQKNLEMNKFKEKQEENIMYMEDMLSSEKIFNKSSINNLKDSIKKYKLSFNSSKEKISTLEKTNSDLKSKELFLERELKLSLQKNEKLTDNNIELTKELRQKHNDNATLTKLLEQTRKEKVESIKLLNTTNQSKLDYLNEKLYQLSESIREKEKEDSKKYQQYIEMKDQYIYLTQEKEMYLQQIKELSFDLKEKNKKIDELILTQSHIATKSNTNDMTLTMDSDDVINFKKIDKDMRCIFVPFYENIFVCINLSENLMEEKDGEIIYLSNYECKYILDMNSFNQELSKIIVDNSLIVIGKVSKLTEIEQTKNKFFNLPENKNFVLVTLGKVDYVIGFPENELIFNNYIN
jgi:hypothetical protein